VLKQKSLRQQTSRSPRPVCLVSFSPGFSPLPRQPAPEASQPIRRRTFAPRQSQLQLRHQLLHQFRQQRAPRLQTDLQGTAHPAVNGAPVREKLRRQRQQMVRIRKNANRGGTKPARKSVCASSHLTPAEQQMAALQMAGLSTNILLQRINPGRRHKLMRHRKAAITTQ
jgi:hypothetical protein